MIMATYLAQRDGSFSLDERARRNGAWNWRTRQFSLEYIVLSDNLSESWMSVEEMADLPHIGDQKDGCTCKSYKLKEQNTVWVNGEPRFLWIIEYQYDSECAAKGGFRLSPDNTWPDPLQWPVEIGWTSQKMKWTFTKDCSDPPKEITNSAGQLFPQEDDIIVPCLTLSRYEPYVWGPTWITTYAQKVNSDEFMGYAAGMCLIDDIQAEREEINGGYYFKVTYKILFSPFSSFSIWDWIIADRGTMMKDPKHPTQIKPVVEIKGTAEEVDLDGEGGELEEGEPKVTITYKRYFPVKFADLNFNLSESDIPENRS